MAHEIRDDFGIKMCKIPVLKKLMGPLAPCKEDPFDNATYAENVTALEVKIEAAHKELKAAFADLILMSTDKSSIRLEGVPEAIVVCQEYIKAASKYKDANHELEQCHFKHLAGLVGGDPVKDYVSSIITPGALAIDFQLSHEDDRQIPQSEILETGELTLEERRLRNKLDNIVRSVDSPEKG